MTPEQIDHHRKCRCGECVERLHQADLDAAVAAEREACATAAEAMLAFNGGWCRKCLLMRTELRRRIAEAIRDRARTAKAPDAMSAETMREISQHALNPDGPLFQGEACDIFEKNSSDAIELEKERDAALAEATNNLQAANENAYAAHQYADERDAARAQVATLSAALSKTRPYLDAVERALVDAALASVGEGA